jgi:hypothetical protein
LELIERVIDKAQWAGGPVKDADELDLAVFRPTALVNGLERITVCYDPDEDEALVAYTLHEEVTVRGVPFGDAAAVRRMAKDVAALRAGGKGGAGD